MRTAKVQANLRYAVVSRKRQVKGKLQPKN